MNISMVLEQHLNKKMKRSQYLQELYLSYLRI